VVKELIMTESLITGADFSRGKLNMTPTSQSCWCCY